MPQMREQEIVRLKALLSEVCFGRFQPKVGVPKDDVIRHPLFVDFSNERSGDLTWGVGQEAVRG